MPLVRYNGERIWQRLPDGVELDDLISAGIFGLMDAIGRITKQLTLLINHVLMHVRSFLVG